MKMVALHQIKDDLSRYLREAEQDSIVITRHGKPAGVLIGFEDEDDWFEYKLEHDPRFLKRIAESRQEIREGKFVRMEDIDWNEGEDGTGDRVTAGEQGS